MPIQLVKIIIDMDENELLRVLKQLETDEKEAYDILYELITDIA